MQQQNTGIALNVARTRITVLVFNLTIISLMLSMASARSINTDLHHLKHLSTDIALLVGFCLTILGIFWLLSSQDLDAQGLSRPWPFSLGAITSYLALSQTITAFMHEYLLGIESVLKAELPVHIAKTASLPFAGETFIPILLFMGSAIWTLTTYIAPIMISCKSPISRQQSWWLAGYYLALQIPIYWIYAQAWSLQYVTENQPLNSLHLFALQFFQPLLWF